MNKKLGLLCSICVLCSGVWSQNLKKFAFSSPKMGTTFRILLYAEDSVQASRAVRAAFDRVDSLNGIMSDYLLESELSLLSKYAGSGTKIPLSDDLWIVLTRAQFVARKSRGAFDVSIGPLSKLWRRAMRKGIFPETDRLRKAQTLVGYKQVKLFPKTKSLKLKKEGMKLDLGGIAKGYAVEEALEVLVRLDLPHALVDGGGDIALGDAPPGAKGWRVKVPAYSYPTTEKTEVLTLHNCHIATSGDTYKYLEWEGKRYSHIIDPRTGVGISERRMVSVIASDGMMADALASTLSVSGRIPDSRLQKKFKDTRIKTRVIEWKDKQ